MKNVLFIVYYFPPMGGSGVQRPLKFAKYLRKFGWNPIILCPEPGAYQFFDDSLDNELSNLKLEIHRVKGLTPFHVLGNKKKSTGLITGVLADTLRRISRWVYFPDNKKGWIKPALEKGVEIINNNSIDLIFSTAPPFSNHILAEKLSDTSGIPYVVDYRDLFNRNHFDKNETEGRISKKRKTEEQWLKKSSGVVILDGSAQKEVENVVNFAEINTRVISHGFDPEDFESVVGSTLDYKKNKLNWLYSGLFYEANQPDTFLVALSISINKNPEIGKNVHLHFQGGLDQRIKKKIDHYKLGNLVSDYGYVSHKESVANIKEADILWMLSNFSEDLKQIKSGKLFEYIGTKKPILGLVHEGESSKLLKEYGAGFVASPNNAKEISEVICIVYQRWKNSELPNPNEKFVSKFDRKKLTSDLAHLFDSIIE